MKWNSHYRAKCDMRLAQISSCFLFSDKMSFSVKKETWMRETNDKEFQIKLKGGIWLSLQGERSEKYLLTWKRRKRRGSFSMYNAYEEILHWKFNFKSSRFLFNLRAKYLGILQQQKHRVVDLKKWFASSFSLELGKLYFVSEKLQNFHVRTL